MLRVFDFPNLDNTCSITADTASSKRRINTRQNGNDILMGFQQVLLVVCDQRHPLNWSVDLIYGRGGSRPSFNMY
jgi:hypothetical protein